MDEDDEAARAELTGFLSTKRDADGLVGALRDIRRDIFDLSSVNELCGQVRRHGRRFGKGLAQPKRATSTDVPPCRSVIRTTAPSWTEAVA